MLKKSPMAILFYNIFEIKKSKGAIPTPAQKQRVFFLYFFFFKQMIANTLTMINEKNISEPMPPQYSEKQNGPPGNQDGEMEFQDGKMQKNNGKKMIENLKALRTNMRINTDSGYYKKAYEIYQEIKKRFLESDVQLPEQCEDIMQEREFEEEVNQTLIQYYLKQVRVYMERSENDLKVPEFRSFDRKSKRLTDTINTLHKQGYNTAKLLKKRDSIRNKCQKLRKKFIAKYRDQKTQLKPREEQDSNCHPQSNSDSHLDSQLDSQLDSHLDSHLDSQPESNPARDFEEDAQELEEVLSFSNERDESSYTPQNKKNDSSEPPKTLLIRPKGSFMEKTREEGGGHVRPQKKGRKTKRKIQKEIDRRLYKEMGTTSLKVFTKEGYKRIKVVPKTPAGKALYHAFDRIFY